MPAGTGEFYSFEYEDNLKVNYITAGMQLRSDPYRMDLSIADSQLFSGAWRKHMILRFAFAINL
jgi:hypothetical protein